YVWDRTQGTVKRITDFTVESSKQKDVFAVLGEYEPLWFDAQTMLVGTIWGQTKANDLENFQAQTQTLVYHLPDGTAMVISPEAVDQWAMNPISGELAFARVVTLNGGPT